MTVSHPHSCGITQLIDGIRVVKRHPDHPSAPKWRKMMETT